MKKFQKLGNFCKQIQEKKDELLTKDGYNYAKSKLQIINDPKFIQKIIKNESKDKPKPFFLTSFQFPVVLCAGTLFFYHLWQVMPYSKIFQHTTISEYTKSLYYPVILAPSSHQTTQSLLLYFPTLIYSLYLNGYYMNYKGMIGLYFINSCISSGIAYCYEKYRNQQQGIDMISPKTLGPCTSLAFLSSSIGLSPDHMIRKKIPLAIIPILYLFYEVEECYLDDSTNCRPAHLMSMLTGFIYGILFKKYFKMI